MPRTVRRLSADDITRILAIQESAYAPHLLESGEVFAAKIAAHGPYCLGLDDSGILAAYVIAMPMAETASVGLHETGTRMPPGGVAAPILYVHDLAVHAESQGTGAARLLLSALASLAESEGHTVTELVAIGTAVGFWKRLGFSETDDETAPEYGTDACKMRGVLTVQGRTRRA